MKYLFYIDSLIDRCFVTTKEQDTELAINQLRRSLSH